MNLPNLNYLELVNDTVHQQINGGTDVFSVATAKAESNPNGSEVFTFGAAGGGIRSKAFTKLGVLNIQNGPIKTGGAFAGVAAGSAGPEGISVSIDVDVDLASFY